MNCLTKFVKKLEVEIRTLFFGICKDVVGKNDELYDLKEGMSVQGFKNFLAQKYVGFKDINDYAVAINEEYVNSDHEIKENDIIAIIPPVSGG